MQCNYRGTVFEIPLYGVNIKQSIEIQQIFLHELTHYRVSYLKHDSKFEENVRICFIACILASLDIFGQVFLNLCRSNIHFDSISRKYGLNSNGGTKVIDSNIDIRSVTIHVCEFLQLLSLRHNQAINLRENSVIPKPAGLIYPQMLTFKIMSSGITKVWNQQRIMD